MNKRTLLWVVAVAVLAILSLAWWMSREARGPAAKTDLPVTEPAKRAESQTAVATATAVAPTPKREEDRGVDPHPMVAATRISEPPPVIDGPPPAILQGSGETAVLSDPNGRPLLKATPANPIYALKPSPSGAQVLLSRGNGLFELYRTNPFELVREMPLKPDDVERASAFESWNWIDEGTLLTSVDIERPPSEGAQVTGAERESPENWRERTLLYSYNLTEGKLAQIDLAKAGLPPSFTVVELRTGGVIKVEWDEKGMVRTAWLAAGSK
jgi:hypothetical protein